MSKKNVSVAALNGRYIGQQSIHATIGPMGKCAEDLETLMKVWTSPRARVLDPNVPPVEWNEEEASGRVKDHGGRPLRIGVMESQEFFEASPACQRAVREAAEAFRRQGAEVVPFHVPNASEASALYYSIMTAEGGMQSFIEALDVSR